MGRETDNSKQDSLKSKSFMQNLIKQSASTRGRGSCSENQDGAVLQGRDLNLYNFGRNSGLLGFSERALDSRS